MGRNILTVTYTAGNFYVYFDFSNDWNKCTHGYIETAKEQFNL